MASQRLRAREEAKTASILYNPEQAAGLTCKDIHDLGKKGLSELRIKDVRFRKYNTDRLFSLTKEVDRRSLSFKQVSAMDKQVSGYLRLLPDFLHLPAALETIEYLLRIYKIHIHNLDDLVFCVLPYHNKPDTPSFVGIVQLVSIGNSNWGFLSQGQLPRCLIIQKFVEDEKLFKALCEFACPKTSKLFLTFATSIVVGVLTDSTTLYQSLPQIYHCFDPKCLLMIITAAADKPCQKTLQQQVMNYILKTAQEDPRLLRLSLMTLVNFVQLQSVNRIRKPLLFQLTGITQTLLELSSEFGIDTFMEILLESFIMSGYSDHHLWDTFVTIVQTVPVKSSVAAQLISKILSKCMIGTTGEWARTMLTPFSLKYPSELRAKALRFLGEIDPQLSNENERLNTLFFMLDFLGITNVNTFKTELFALLSERAQNTPSFSVLKYTRDLMLGDTFLECFRMMSEEFVLSDVTNAQLVTSFVFLADIIMKWDATCIGIMHEKILGQCIVAFGIQSENDLQTLKVDDVERTVIKAITSLMMRVSEHEFRMLKDKVIMGIESESLRSKISGRVELSCGSLEF